MNTYEKIIVGVIGIVVVVLSVFSYIEFTEDAYTEFSEGEASDFDESFGTSFVMGVFDTVVDTTVSDEKEADCALQEPVVLSVLHDLNEMIEKSYSSIWEENDSFEVNQETLQALCAKEATLTLSNVDGGTLILKKIPFVPNVVSEQYQGQIGTQVEIQATIIRADQQEDGIPNSFSRMMLIPYNMLEQ